MNQWKSYFPALRDEQYSYLDSASSCQIPESVITAISNYLSNGHGNPNRGLYEWAEKAETLKENCRNKVAQWLGVSASQIIFTQHTTEAINLVAESLSDCLGPSNTILVSEMEHHANLLPWQALSKRTGAGLNFLKLNQNAELDLSELENLLQQNCKILAISQVSNVLGTTNPLERIIPLAHRYGVKVLVDGAQAIAHTSQNLSLLGCDYYVFSAHKHYGPTGIGVLFARQPESLKPRLLGGGIVTKVDQQAYTLSTGIERFESGTANMIGLAGLDASLDFVAEYSQTDFLTNLHQLTSELSEIIRTLGYQIISHPKSLSIVSFASTHFHAHDIATVLSENQVAVRAGHHCAQPCLRAVGVKSCVRTSIGIYNDHADIEKFAYALAQVNRLLS